MAVKFKTTKKAMRDGYSKIISIGYCDAHYLLRFRNPIAYSCGESGWFCDYYEIDGVLISTGYNPVNSKGTNITYEELQGFEDEAKAVDYWSPDAKAQTEAILKRMVAKASARKARKDERQ